SLVVRGTTFLANTAVLGGGIFHDGGPLTLTNSTFSGNTATGNAYIPVEGGAIWSVGTLDVRGSTFTGNSATDFGGAIFIQVGPATLQQCTLSGNSAGSKGGGIYNDAYGTLAVKESTVLNNLAPLDTDIYNLGTLILKDSIVGVIGP